MRSVSSVSTQVSGVSSPTEILSLALLILAAVVLITVSGVLVGRWRSRRSARKRLVIQMARTSKVLQDSMEPLGREVFLNLQQISTVINGLTDSFIQLGETLGDIPTTATHADNASGQRND